MAVAVGRSLGSAWSMPLASMRREPCPIRAWTCWIGLACACLLLSASASAQSEAQAASAVVPEPAARQVFASRHYHIHTDLTREETVPYGRHLDAVHDAYRRRFAAFVSRTDEPMPVYLFRHEAGYHAFLESVGIAARHSGGMFFVTHRGKGLATFVEGQSRDEVFDVLQHEGFHQFAWKFLGAGLPTWINEGLAQYFEDAPLVNGELVIGQIDRARLNRVRDALTQGQTLPLRELFALSDAAWGEALHANQDHSGLLYAQAWSVVYFLIHGEDGRYREAFHDVLVAIARGQPADEAFDATFGTGSASRMERRWATYVRQLPKPALTAAAENLEFLAIAIGYYDQQGWPIPSDLSTLETQLRRMGFAIRRVEQGVETIVKAEDPANFRYSLGRVGADDRRFTMLAPSRDDLPPRLVAKGLIPEPSIEWTRAADGTLRHTLVYR